MLIGACFYGDLGGTYRPGSHEEALALLTQELKALDKTGALKYGYWLQTRGVPYQHFEATGLFEGTFKGQVLYNRPLKAKGWQRLKKNIKRLF